MGLERQLVTVARFLFAPRHASTSGVRPCSLMFRHSGGNQAGGYWKPMITNKRIPSFSASETRKSGFSHSHLFVSVLTCPQTNSQRTELAYIFLNSSKS